MERWLKKTIELMAGLSFTNKINPSVVPYHPQKTVTSGNEEQYFERTAPERLGVSSGRLLAMLRALEKNKRANVHTLLIIKDSQVILECSHPGYCTNTWHLSHSMSKTVTGMAIGMLVDDGLLDVNTRLIDIFPEYHYTDRRFASITVHHLLNMSAGVKFAEVGSITESHWTSAFFNAPLEFTPGTDFQYNSMNSYILARIVCKITRKGLCEFLSERLFKPLGITNYFWEKSPEEIEKGGWGLYMSVESWAKLGVLVLEGGVFDGKRILSREWINRSCTTQSVTPEKIGHYNYGYQIWVSRDGSSILFNGMLGQNVWIYPKNNIVLALNSGNNELFQNSPAMQIIEQYLSVDLENDLTNSCFAGDYDELKNAIEHFFECRHWIRPYTPKKGITYRLGLRERTPYPYEWEELVGKYNFRKNNFGTLPLFVRMMQNNLRNTIDGVSFEHDGEGMIFTVFEGGVPYSFELGFYDFKESVIDYHGERYTVKCIGEAMEDEDRNMLYKVELLFPELPNTRMFKFSFGERGELLMRMSEMPNQAIADVYISEMQATSPKMTLAMGLIEKKVGKSYVNRKMLETFAPSLIGAKVGTENYTVIMDEEREKLKANEKSARLINTVIEKLFKDDGDDARAVDDEDNPIRSFFGDIIGRIKEIMPAKAQKKDSKGKLPPSEQLRIEGKKE